MDEVSRCREYDLEQEGATVSDSATTDAIVQGYLRDLRRALRSKDTTNTSEFIAAIKQHIIEGRSKLDPDQETIVVRDRLDDANCDSEAVVGPPHTAVRTDRGDRRATPPPSRQCSLHRGLVRLVHNHDPSSDDSWPTQYDVRIDVESLGRFIPRGTPSTRSRRNDHLTAGLVSPAHCARIAH